MESSIGTRVFEGGFGPDEDELNKLKADVANYNQIGMSIFYSLHGVTLPLGQYEIAAVVLLKSGERALYKGLEFEVKLPLQPLLLDEQTSQPAPKDAELCLQEPEPTVVKE